MFYNAEGHQASFSLPPVALRELSKPRPSLEDTSRDLEEIMAYGQPDAGAEGAKRFLSDLWEGDVGFKQTIRICMSFDTQN